MYERRVNRLYEGCLVEARVPAVLAEHFLRHVGGERPPVDDERADVFFSCDFRRDRVQHRSLRPAVAVEYDDVLETVLRQAFENLFYEGAIGRLRYLKRARISLHAARDAVR